MVILLLCVIIYLIYLKIYNIYILDYINNILIKHQV